MAGTSGDGATDSTTTGTGQRAGHQPSELDMDAVKMFGLKVWTYKMGEIVSLMVHLGDSLGLYEAMHDTGTMSSDELAANAGLNERLVREWLLGQAAAGLIERTDDGRFELTPVQAAVLAREDDSLDFAAGAFRGGVSDETVDALVESFKTGTGITYEQQGTAATAGLARMTAPRSKLALVSTVVPAVEGLEERMRSGIKVLEIGCGAGVALTTLAQAFPQSQFVGIDPSPTAIAMAGELAAEAGVSNMSFVEGFAGDIETSGDIGLAMAFDCLHDMPHPDEAVASIGAAMSDDGVFLIKDIRSSGDFDKDRRNPLLALMYGFSVSSCLQSAMSEPGGMALGTVGLHPKRLTELVQANGFSSVAVHDLDDPSNLYYEVRK